MKWYMLCELCKPMPHGGRSIRASAITCRPQNRLPFKPASTLEIARSLGRAIAGIFARCSCRCLCFGLLRLRAADEGVRRSLLAGLARHVGAPINLIQPQHWGDAEFLKFYSHLLRATTFVDDPQPQLYWPSLQLFICIELLGHVGQNGFVVLLVGALVLDSLIDT